LTTPNTSHISAPTNVFGQNTLACKRYHLDAVKELYILDNDRQMAAFGGHNQNNDKEILQWMFMCGELPPDPPHMDIDPTP
jgi:hypothetical protein